MKKIIKLLTTLSFIMVICFITPLIINADTNKDSEAFLTDINFQSMPDKIDIIDGVESEERDGIQYYTIQDPNRFVYLAKISKRRQTYQIKVEVSPGATYRINDIARDEELNTQFFMYIFEKGWTTIEVTSKDGTATNTYYLLQFSDNIAGVNYYDFIPTLDTVTTEDKEVLNIIKQEYAKKENKDEAIIKLIDDDLAKIDDMEKADSVSKEIEAISEDTPDAGAVKKAREDYKALTSDQQALITDDVKTKLATAEEKIAEAVKELIDALPADGSDADAVANARSAFNALTDEEKEYVKEDEKILIAAEEAVEAKKAADEAAKKATNVKTGEAFKVGKNNLKVTKISGKAGEVAFVNCTSKKLTKVTIPASVDYKGCTFKVTSIQKNALKGYKKLKTVTIGKNITNIGANAFFGDAKLKKITVQSTGLKKVGAKALKGIHKKAVIKVPKKMLKKYKKLFKGKGQKKTVKVK